MFLQDSGVLCCDKTVVWLFQSVTSPHSLHDLSPEVRYTFTITAHNSKGSGPPAPWVSLYFDIKCMSPLSIGVCLIFKLLFYLDRSRL